MISDFMPSDLQEIQRLKKEENAIILAHNYQRGDIQEIADFVGDSLELCIKASEIEESEVVVFCGVDFMAETAAILNPDKKILTPDTHAKCPMAAMLTAEEIKKFKKMYPDTAVVLYINTTAESKAEAEILCTSSNAVKVVESLPQKRILFGPDMNLGWYVSKKVNKEIIHVPKHGNCYVHKLFHLRDLHFLKSKYHDAEILVHPECDPEVQNFADNVLSTGGMIRYVARSPKKTFIIGTEVDMITRLKRENPDKTFIPALNDAICENMKRYTVKSVKNCLLNKKFEVKVDDNTAEKAKVAIKRMIKVSKN